MQVDGSTSDADVRALLKVTVTVNRTTVHKMKMVRNADASVADSANTLAPPTATTVTSARAVLDGYVLLTNYKLLYLSHSCKSFNIDVNFKLR